MSPVIEVKPSLTETAAARFRRRLADIWASETAKADAVIERIMRPFLERVGA